jgi:hypothetical protein
MFTTRRYHQLVSEALTKVPSADYYILEEMPPILPKVQSSKVHPGLTSVPRTLL